MRHWITSFRLLDREPEDRRFMIALEASCFCSAFWPLCLMGCAQPYRRNQLAARLFPT